MLNLKDDSWMMSPFPKDQLTVIFENAYFVKKCRGCNNEFTSVIRKHHCRGCGKVFCGQCSRKNHDQRNLDKEPIKLRLCTPCELKSGKEQNASSIDEDKENLLRYGNAIKLSFDMESESPLKSTSTPIGSDTTELSYSHNVPLLSPVTPHVTLRTPRRQKSFDSSVICTPPQEPESEKPIDTKNKSKYDKKCALNACCIFLLVFCVSWFAGQWIRASPHLSGTDIPLEFYNNNVIDVSVLDGENVFQSVINHQVVIVEQRMLQLMKPPKEDEEVQEDLPHEISVAIQRKDRRHGLKDQVARWNLRGKLFNVFKTLTSKLINGVKNVWNFLLTRRQHNKNKHQQQPQQAPAAHTLSEIY